LVRVKRIAGALGGLLDRITRALWLLAGFLILIMALVVGYAVVMRYVFRNPDPYSYELISIFMLVTVVFALAHTQRTGRNIRIDLLERFFPGLMRDTIRDIIGPLMGLVLSVLLTWQSLDDAIFALQTSQLTRGTFVIPTFPIKITVAIGAGLLSLVLVAQIARYICSLLNKDMANT
jgi:TRAP-type mannitol/chloroaromatic compound transport system permease small subunit